MIVDRYKFLFIFIFIFLKLSSTYLYFLSFNSLDYSEIYDVFCSYDADYKGNFNLLNSFHSSLFIFGCGFGKSLYFWFFALLQIIILIAAFSKIYSYKFQYKKVFLAALFFSPTILFYSSPPTKDGFFIFLICFGIIFSKQIRNFILIISALIKPYVLGLIVLKFHSFFVKVFMLLLMSIFLILFYEQILNIFFIKISVFSINLKPTSIIWITEIFLVFYFARLARIITILDILLITTLCLIGIGSNINVASRIAIVSVFFLLAWKTSSYDKK